MIIFMGTPFLVCSRKDGKIQALHSQHSLNVVVFFAALIDRKSSHFQAETAPAISENGAVWPPIPGGGTQEFSTEGFAILVPVSLPISLPKPEPFLHCALPISELEKLRGLHHSKERRHAKACSHHQ
jgi:hypothetical protein